MSLTTVVSIAVALCDGIRFLESTCKSYGDDENKWLHIITSVNRLAILSLNIGSKVSKAKNIDPEKINTLKTGEILARLTDFVTRIIEFTRNSDEEDSAFLRYCEKAVIAPLLGVLYNINEMIINEEEKALQEYEKKGSEAMRPIYENDEETGTTKIIGYEPIDPVKCKETIESTKKEANFEGILKLISEIGLKNIKSAPRSLYEELSLYLKFRETLKARLDSTSESDKKVIDLLALETIPDPLHGDIVFRRYLCPVARMPIRDPVGDPNGITLYERRFIVRWLRTHPSSPITRAPLTISQLVEKPALKVLIDSRLKFHEIRLKDFLENRGRFNLGAPVDPNLQANANAENPSS